MTDEDLLPEDIDAIEGIPLPRWRATLRGHDGAEAAILDAYRQNRLHHAFLIGGPQGIGKATFAFRVARFLLRHPDPSSEAVQAARDLSVAAHDPVFARVASLTHPDFFLLRRTLEEKKKQIRTVIAVDDVRDLRHMFHATSGALGWRVAIVDTADELNAASGNALLKMLEEPPPRALFLILADQPGSVLATIRSRCRRLTLSPLSLEDTDAVVSELVPDIAAELRREAVSRAHGSPRRALALLDQASLDVVVATEALLARLPRLDVRAAHALADKMSRRDGDDALTLMRETVAEWVGRRVRAGVDAGEPLHALARLAERLALVEQHQAAVDIYNLDRRQAVVSTFTELAAALGRRGAA